MHQLDLLVAERADLLTIEGNGADELILLEHRYESQSVNASGVNGGKSQWMAVEIRLIFSEISDLKRLSGFSNTAHGCCTADRGASPHLDVCRRKHTVECNVAEAVSSF